MKALYELLLSWPHEVLAQSHADLVRQHIALRDRVGALETEIFWLKVAERNDDESPAAPQ